MKETNETDRLKKENEELRQKINNIVRKSHNVCRYCSKKNCYYKDDYTTRCSDFVMK